ncbi:MAG: 1-acyl-sn-glycerol-3-phosphate acyltransferase [Endomicrobia bacterium]|nr:1-acyl-sn-glycerol-3-phosphate acyltransferase [Endomicrobiia bacterium]
MTDFFKYIYAFPFAAAAYAWLFMTGMLAYPYFYLTGYKESQIRSFLYFSGKAVQLAIFGASGFSKKIIEKSPFPQKPSVLVANHPCMYDTFLFFDFGIKNLVCIAKGWPFKIIFFGKFIEKAGYINTDGKRSEDIIALAAGKLAEGLHIAIFPEGTRSVNIGRFRTLAFEIAVKTGADVVPFAIKGLDEMLPRGRYFPKKVPVSYVRLEAVSPQAFGFEAGGLRMARYVKEKIVEELQKNN